MNVYSNTEAIVFSELDMNSQRDRGDHGVRNVESLLCVES